MIVPCILGVEKFMTVLSARAAKFAGLLSQDVIILKDLQAAAALGVPDDVRPTVWKVFTAMHSRFGVA